MIIFISFKKLFEIPLSHLYLFIIINFCALAVRFRLVLRLNRNAWFMVDFSAYDLVGKSTTNKLNPVLYI